MILIADPSLFTDPEIEMYKVLVASGEEKSSLNLSEDLFGFLVCLLYDYRTDKEIVDEVLAFNFFNGEKRSGAMQSFFLKRGGDVSLLYAGLEPYRVNALHVNRSYFRDMGQGFYSTLGNHWSAHFSLEEGEFYKKVAINFSILERVLYSARSEIHDSWHAYHRFYLRCLS